MTYHVGWTSVDGAGSQKREFATFADAKSEADRMQFESDNNECDGVINPFGYRYWVGARGDIVYRTTPRVMPGTKVAA